MRRNFRSLKPSQPIARQNLRIVGSLTPRSAATERTLERTKSSGEARIRFAILTSDRVIESIRPSSRGRISSRSGAVRGLFISPSSQVRGYIEMSHVLHFYLTMLHF